MVLIEKSNSITLTDNNERVLIDDIPLTPFQYSATIFLDQMQAGDEITIREYLQDPIGGIVKKTRTFSYANAQASSCMLSFNPTSRFKVTIQQTQGTLRGFNYVKEIVSSSSTKYLPVIMFAPNLTIQTGQMLTTHFKGGDGFIASDPNTITSNQNAANVSGLKNYYLSPNRTGPEAGCGLGPVLTMQQFVNDANANPARRIAAILYDLEGWCWTPASERGSSPGDGIFVASMDTGAGIVHSGSLLSGCQPTHDLYLQYYTFMHFANLDFILLQWQNYMCISNTIGNPGIHIISEAEMTNIQNIINTIRSQNPSALIYLQFNLMSTEIENMKIIIDRFRAQLDGVSLVNLSPTDPDSQNKPFIANNTTANQQTFIDYAHGVI